MVWVVHQQPAASHVAVADGLHLVDAKALAQVVVLAEQLMQQQHHLQQQSAHALEVAMAATVTCSCG
jgi:hypothetical protein